VVPAPTILAIDPTSGTTPASVTLTGTNFINGGTVVTVNGIALPATDVTFLDSMDLLLALPAETPGTTLVVGVTTAGGPSNTKNFTVSSAVNPLCPPLGTSANFAVLGASAVSNTGGTVISASAGGVDNVGVSPTAVLGGFPPGVINPPGIQHIADAVAAQAQTDAKNAYTNLAAAAPATPISSSPTSLGPGIYSAGTLNITSTLTLTGVGVYIFQIGTTFMVADNQSIVLNGAASCNVFWQVGSSATFGVNSVVPGTVIALESITANTGASFNGRLIALNGAVSLNNNQVTIPPCTCS
jgi:hypothetical protein